MRKIIENVNKVINEDTISGAIAYLPNGFTSVKKSIISLLQMKDKWGIEVLENMDSYDVSFENQLKIIIPKEHYKHFNENVINIDGVKEINLGQFLNEAIQFNFEELLNTLSSTLRKVLIIKRAIFLENSWILTFDNTQLFQLDPKNVLINLALYDRSISNLLKKINKEHAEDKGYIEEVVDKIENASPLNTLNIFNSSRNLAGFVAKAKLNEVELVFNCFIDLAFRANQFIVVTGVSDSMDKFLEEASYLRELKISNKIIYPVAGEFSPYIFTNLNNILKELQ